MANTNREPKESVILRYPDIVVGVSRWVFVFSQFITSFEAASTACLQEAGSQSRTSKEINAVGCEKPIWSPFRWRKIFIWNCERYVSASRNHVFIVLILGMRWIHTKNIYCQCHWKSDKNWRPFAVSESFLWTFVCCRDSFLSTVAVDNACLL